MIEILMVIVFVLIIFVIKMLYEIKDLKIKNKYLRKEFEDTRNAFVVFLKHIEKEEVVLVKINKESKKND